MENCSGGSLGQIIKEHNSGSDYEDDDNDNENTDDDLTEFT